MGGDGKLLGWGHGRGGGRAGAAGPGTGNLRELLSLLLARFARAQVC